MYSYYVPFFDNHMNDVNFKTHMNGQNQMNVQSQDFFDPFNGLMKGNMFPNLYLPYRNFTNFPIKPMNERERLMNEVQAYGFALTDLNLYLDLYKEDKQALSLYKRYLTEYRNAKNTYESKYGPINTSSNVLGSYPWAWVEGPWPWERG